MRTLMLFAVGIVMSVSDVSAQGTGQPFCPPGTSQAEVVRMIASNDLESRCYLTAEMFREITNERLEELGASIIPDLASLALFVSNLQRVPCVDVVSEGGNFQMARLLSGVSDMTGSWSRGCRDGEAFLCDGNLAVCVYAEDCWNVLLHDYFPRQELRLVESSVFRAQAVTPDSIFVIHSGMVDVNVLGSLDVIGLVQETPRERSAWIRYLRPIFKGVVATGALAAVACTAFDFDCVPSSSATAIAISR